MQSCCSCDLQNNLLEEKDTKKFQALDYFSLVASNLVSEDVKSN